MILVNIHIGHPGWLIYVFSSQYRLTRAKSDFGDFAVSSASGRIVQAPRKLLNSVTIDGVDAFTPGDKETMAAVFNRVQKGLDYGTGRAWLEAGKLAVITGGAAVAQGLGGKAK